MIIGKTTINFLGMTISYGKCVPQPHIVTALKSFPDILTSPKMIQQFLGLVNYMTDFIPHVTKERFLLTQLLKKGSPPWNNIHTKGVKSLNKKVESLPLFKFLAQGKEFYK